MKKQTPALSSTLNRRRRDAFTLIELLVVIAIIAILASLLTAGLSRAKDAAKLIKCKSNLHQMGIALTMYVLDFGAYPLSGKSPYVSSEFALTGWQRQLREYAAEPVLWRNSDNHSGRIVFKKTGIFRCPSVRTNRWDAKNWPGLWGGSGYENDYYSEHYGFNYEGAYYDQGLAWDIVGTNLLAKAVREVDVKVPSDMLALSDGFFAGQWGGKRFIQRSPELGRDSWGSSVFSREDTKISRQRHGNRVATAFCDGHVETVKMDTLFNSTLPRDLRRWSRDNETHMSAHPQGEF